MNLLEEIRRDLEDANLGGWDSLICLERKAPAYIAYLLERLDRAEDLARLCTDDDDTARQYRAAWLRSKEAPDAV